MKVITQETFDSAVKENMDEFGMSKEEAVKDAKDQFEAQGVCLTNIVTTGAEEDGQHSVLKALQVIKSADSVEETLLKNCEVVTSELEKDIAIRVLATKNEGYEVLIGCCLRNEEKNEKVLGQSLKALTAFLDGNPDPMDQRCVDIIKRNLNRSHDMTVSGLELCLNCCVRHEDNRVALVKSDILDLLDEAYTSGQEVRVSRIWQALVQDDDIRVPYGNAHDNARCIVEDHSALSKLVKSVGAKTNPENLEEDKETAKSRRKDLEQLLGCLSNLTVRNEYCEAVVNDGGLKILLDLLVDAADQSTGVVKQSLTLIKTLAGNDNVKKDVRELGGIPLIVNAIQENVKVKSVCWAGCSCITSICLRQPESAKQLVSSGGAILLAQILETNKDNPKILTSCANAIRNIVSRSRDLSKDFLDRDVEKLLNQAIINHPKTADAVRSALRDLGCNVEINENWTVGAVKQDEQ